MFRGFWGVGDGNKTPKLRRVVKKPYLCTRESEITVMKVLIVNTSERIGGAAIAANRLMEALHHHGVLAHMLVRDRQTQQLTVTTVKQSWRLPLRFLWERAVILWHNGFSCQRLWKVDIANVGTDITRTVEFRQADVVHLHWVNQGFLSLSDLEKIFRSGKRVVITLHNQWYYTGICQYALGCDRFRVCCRACPYIGKHHLGSDLARRVFEQKRRIYAQAHITFVGCSQWIAEEARKSILTKGQHVVSIPNPIDTSLFKPIEQTAARQRLGLPLDRKLILFSSQRTTDSIKGFDFFAQACQLLQERHGDLRIGLVVVGKDSGKSCLGLSQEVFPVSYVSKEQQMVDIYNAVDAYVTSSLCDNLPNTIMEALACGTPCVGFRTGGIPEMIRHGENGYVARYRDAEDLAEGIVWTLDPVRYDTLARNARQFVLEHYNEETVARQYLKVYQG